MAGIDQVNAMFAQEGRIAAFMPYFPVGYPDLATSIDIMTALAESGADAIEVGVPFSDPLADGPTIQAATQRALQNGTRLSDCLTAMQTLRARSVSIPLMLMSYANPLMAYGYDKLVADATAAGASGFIVPDLPVDEAEVFQTATEAHGAALAHFLAPTSSPSRIALAAERARGFIYLVSVAGVTGERTELPPDLKDFIERVRRVAQQPLVVGFGINTPEKARAVGDIADGIIIGSKLIRLAEESPQQVVAFAQAVINALQVNQAQ